MKTTLAWLTAGAILATGASAHAVQLLANPNLQTAASQSPIPGWTLNQFYTTAAGTPGSASQVNFAHNPASPSGTTGQGLWLKPFASGSGAGYVDTVGATLSQSVAAIAGTSYTFSADARWEDDYSGAASNSVLSGNTPLGTGPSPTSTSIIMQFLDAGGSPVGSPFVTDLKAAGQLANNAWATRTVTGVAPVGATQVRVTAEARQMVFNDYFGGDPMSAFYDNFSLKAATAPTTELLANAGFDEAPPTPVDFPGWTAINTAKDALGVPIADLPGTFGGDYPNFAMSQISASWASKTQSDSDRGAWFRNFEGGTDGKQVDGALQQTVAAVPGGNYSFTGWSKWEGNASSAVATISATSPNGPWANKPSPTQTYMTMEFLDGSGVVIGAPITVDLKAAGQVGDGTWRQYTVNGTAPANAASVRVTAGEKNMVLNIDPQQSSFFDDFELNGPAPGTPGDFNGDSKVNGADFLVWQRGFPATKTATDLANWKANYGTGAGVAVVGAVPEPASIVVGLSGIASLAAARGRRRS